MRIEFICLQGFVLLMIAIYGATTPKTPALLRNYFVTQGFYAVFILGAQLFVTRSAFLYHAVYIGMTIAMLFWVVLIAVIFSARHEKTWLILFTAFIVAAAPSWMATRENLPNTFSEWIVVCEGATLLAMGLLAGMSAPFLYWAHRKVAVTLAAMWVLLGMFREGYWLHWSSESWRILDDWFPWIITCAGMGTAAYLMHRYSNFLAQPRSGGPHANHG